MNNIEKKDSCRSILYGTIMLIVFMIYLGIMIYIGHIRHWPIDIILFVCVIGFMVVTTSYFVFQRYKQRKINDNRYNIWCNADFIMPDSDIVDDTMVEMVHA